MKYTLIPGDKTYGIITDINMANTISITTHWEPEQLIELAGIIPEGWNQVYMSYGEWDWEHTQNNDNFHKFLNGLISLSLDMKAKGLSREEYIKLLEGK